MKNLLTTNWSWFRVLRLVIGVSALIDGLDRTDWLLIGLSSILIYQGVMNTGCGFGGSCAIPQDNKTKSCNTN